MINCGATLVSRLAILVAFMFTLAACGGGGGSTFYDEGDDDTPPVTTTYTVTLTLFDASGMPTTSMPQSAEGTVQIVVTENNDTAAPLAGALVNVAVGAGTLAPTSGTTDENGVVTLSITAGSVLGPVTITAVTSISSETYTGVLSYEVVEFVPYLLELTLLGPDGMPTDSLAIDTQGTLQAKITSADASGAPVAGVLVNITTNIGSLVPASGRAITDADGIAALAVVAGTTAGAGVLTTSAVVENTPLNTELNFEVTDEAVVISYFLQLTLLDSDGQTTTTLDQTEQGTLRAKITAGSADGTPVSGALVSATTDIGTLAPSNGQLLSDDNGIADFPVTAGSITGAGTISATLEIGGTTVDSSALNFQVANDGVVVTAYFIELILLGPDGQPTTSLAKNTQGTVQARMTVGSENGNPVAGEIVTVSATVGSLTPGSGRALTNSSGFASFSAIAGSIIGAGSFTATIELGGNTYTDVLNYEVVDSIPYSLVLTLLGPDGQPTTTLAKNTQGTLQAKVTSTDGNNTPAVGALIIASSTIGNLVPSNGQALSNSSGYATFTVEAGSTIAAGAVTASVEIDTDTFTDSLNFEIVEDISYTLELTLLGPNGQPTTTLTKNTQGTLQALITTTDGSSTPVVGVVVSASSTIGSLLPSNALSNASGIATFTVEAGPTISAGAVTASVEIGGDTFADSLNFEIIDELYFLTLTLLDEDDQAAISLTERTEGNLQIVVTKDSENGPPVVGTIVTAATQLGSLEPDNGLTDSNGMVTLKFIVGSTVGAGTVGASTEINSDTISNSLNFEITKRIRKLGYFDGNDFIENKILTIPGPNSTLSAGADAHLSVVILDENDERITEQEEVIFTSGCIAANQSTISPINPISVYAEAITTYSTVSCSGIDNLTASIAGTDAEATGTLDVAAPETTAIHFISADPEVIALRGTGGADRSETSNLVFRVIDQSGRPLPGITVKFELDAKSSSVGGLVLSNDEGFSNADGDVTVTVRSGDVASPIVVVTASVGEGIDKVEAPSSILTVTTGLPEQNSISLATERFIIPNAANMDGEINELTVRLDDRFNNKVPGGTAAVFRTEYGSIDPSCTTDTLDTSGAGACTVDWESSAPRSPKLGDENVRTILNTDCPVFVGLNFVPCPEDLGFTRGMRSTVMVFAIGEETFIDRNGNGIMDEDEKDLFVNLGEAFEDHNEDGVFTPADAECVGKDFDDPTLSARCKAGFDEEFIDFNTNGQYDPEGPSPLYNGLRCPIEGNDVWCSRTLLNVWDDLVLTLSHNPSWDSVMIRDSAVVVRTITGEEQTVYISDQYNNAPPAGSTVTLAAEDNCEIVGLDSVEVPSLYFQGAFGLNVTTKRLDTPPVNPEFGTFSVTLNPVDGSAKRWDFYCDTPPAP